MKRLGEYILAPAGRDLPQRSSHQPLTSRPCWLEQAAYMSTSHEGIRRLGCRPQAEGAKADS